jgi:hypothetical protein
VTVEEMFDNDNQILDVDKMISLVVLDFLFQPNIVHFEELAVYNHLQLDLLMDHFFVVATIHWYLIILFSHKLVLKFIYHHRFLLK